MLNSEAFLNAHQFSRLRVAPAVPIQTHLHHGVAGLRKELIGQIDGR